MRSVAKTLKMSQSVEEKRENDKQLKRIARTTEIRACPPLNELADNKERENFLLEFAAEHSRSGAPIHLKEGWSILRDYGLNILFNILDGKKGLCDGKPFGNRGFSGLNRYLLLNQQLRFVLFC